MGNDVGLRGKSLGFGERENCWKRDRFAHTIYIISNVRKSCAFIRVGDTLSWTRTKLVSNRRPGASLTFTRERRLRNGETAGAIRNRSGLRATLLFSKCACSLTGDVCRGGGARGGGRGRRRNARPRRGSAGHPRSKAVRVAAKGGGRGTGSRDSAAGRPVDN